MTWFLDQSATKDKTPLGKETEMMVRLQPDHMTVVQRDLLDDLNTLLRLCQPIKYLAWRRRIPPQPENLQAMVRFERLHDSAGLSPLSLIWMISRALTGDCLGVVLEDQDLITEFCWMRDVSQAFVPIACADLGPPWFVAQPGVWR